MVKYYYMASRTNKSTQNQGPRLAPAKKKGKVAKNPMKPQIAARIKNSQGLGGGVKQGRGGAKYITSAAQRGTKVGVNQKYGFPGTKKVKGPSAKTNLPRIKAQPKSPKNLPKQPKNNFTLHNNVGPGDVARLRKASQMAPVKMGGGNFGGFIAK